MLVITMADPGEPNCSKIVPMISGVVILLEPNIQEWE